LLKDLVLFSVNASFGSESAFTSTGQLSADFLGNRWPGFWRLVEWIVETSVEIAIGKLTPVPGLNIKHAM
jgi:hypothetical protein